MPSFVEGLMNGILKERESQSQLADKIKADRESKLLDMQMQSEQLKGLASNKNAELAQAAALKQQEEQNNPENFIPYKTMADVPNEVKTAMGDTWPLLVGAPQKHVTNIKTSIIAAKKAAEVANQGTERALKVAGVNAQKQGQMDAAKQHQQLLNDQATGKINTLVGAQAASQELGGTAVGDNGLGRLWAKVMGHPRPGHLDMSGQTPRPLNGLVPPPTPQVQSPADRLLNKYLAPGQ